MNTQPTIHKVVYRWGMVTDAANWQGLRTITLEQSQLSPKVVNAIFDNGLLTAGGVYGVPEVGDPIEINWLQITHDHGVTEITVYNLGIMLLATNDEIYSRILRVCSAIRRQGAVQ
ncbi:MAG: hypothetical protein QXP01_04250 [Candidatus Hadarchaeum sp.]